MRGILFILLIVLTTVSCSKESSLSDKDIFSDGFNKSGVRTNLNKEEFTFDRYYTKVSTFPNKVYLAPFIEVLYKEGGSVCVKWTYNNASIDNNEINIYWNADKQKWQSVNYPKIELEKGFNFGDKINSTVELANGETFIYEQTIQENKISRDILGVNFGMTKEDVITNENKRTGGIACKEYQPNTLTMPLSANIDKGLTIYRFKNNKLVEVGEYVYPAVILYGTEKKELNPIVVDYCKSIGLMETPKIDENGNLIKDYTWSNGGIVFTLSIVTDAPAPIIKSNSSQSKALGVSYRLK